MVVNNDHMKSVLQFMDYVVDYVEFKSNPKFHQNNVKINFSLDKNTRYSDDGLMLVSIHADVFKDPEENNYPFSIKLMLTGIFKFDESQERTDKEYLAFEKNAIAILFPYLRSLITTYTANSNMPTLVLPPINVNKFIEDQEQKNQVGK